MLKAWVVEMKFESCADNGARLRDYVLKPASGSPDNQE